MEKLINTLLRDEHGISEEAFNALLEMVQCLSDPIRSRLLNLLHNADATDGRFYLDN